MVLTRTLKITCLLWVLVLPLVLSSAGQSPTSSTPADSASGAMPAFDVISVKPSRNDIGDISIQFSRTSVRISNMSVAMLLASAYDTRRELLSGLPLWAQRDRWDIQAKVVDSSPAPLGSGTGTSDVYSRLQVQSILKERFNIRTHTEIRILPVYNLVVDKSPKLVPSKAPAGERGNMFTNNTDIKGVGIPVASLTKALSSILKRDVIDKTSLLGTYDFHLRWSSEQPGTSQADSGSTDELPMLFEAVQRQLGLKLVPSKAPVQAVVVDNVDRPSPD